MQKHTGYNVKVKYEVRLCRNAYMMKTQLQNMSYAAVELFLNVHRDPSHTFWKKISLLFLSLNDR